MHADHISTTVSGKCGHNFHMVSDPTISGGVVRSRAKGFQHCIVEWIKQDSSKGQCPMCRQSECSAPLGRGRLLTVFPEFAWTNPTDVTPTANPESEATAA